MKGVEYISHIKLAIRFKFEMEYTGVVFAKNPPMMKSEKSFRKRT